MRGMTRVVLGLVRLLLHALKVLDSIWVRLVALWFWRGYLLVRCQLVLCEQHVRDGFFLKLRNVPICLVSRTKVSHFTISTRGTASDCCLPFVRPFGQVQNIEILIHDSIEDSSLWWCKLILEFRVKLELPILQSFFSLFSLGLVHCGPATRNLKRLWILFTLGHLRFDSLCEGTMIHLLFFLSFGLFVRRSDFDFLAFCCPRSVVLDLDCNFVVVFLFWLLSCFQELLLTMTFHVLFSVLLGLCSLILIVNFANTRFATVQILVIELTGDSRRLITCWVSLTRQGEV